MDVLFCQNSFLSLFQILTLRIVHEQQIRLLSSSEQKDLRTAEAFHPFMGLNPLQYNPYTMPLWNAAVAQYDKIMAPVEQKIAGKLRSQFKGLEGYPQQVNLIFIHVVKRLKFKLLVRKLEKLLISDLKSVLIFSYSY